MDGSSTDLGTAPWESPYRHGTPPDRLSEVRSTRRLRLVALSALRRDFKDRCCYCTGSTIEKGGEENFDVEHFRPKGRPEFAHLQFEYSNLYYACRGCNTGKGPLWPDEDDDSWRFVDPCEEALYPVYLNIVPGGTIVPVRAPGTRLHEIFKFDKRRGVRTFLLLRERRGELYDAIRAGDLDRALLLVDELEQSVCGE